MPAFRFRLRRYPSLNACAGALALLGAVAGAAAGPAPATQRLLIEVRSTPPDDRPAFQRGADRSYTVSSGGTDERDDLPAATAGHRGTVLRGGGALRVLHVRAGEALRVDLPSRQALQFHLAAPPAPGGHGTAVPAAPGALAPRGAAAGVVYFDAVAAFAARFYLEGDLVRIELVPLQASGVVAPWIDVAAARTVHEPGSALRLQGRPGAWIALGDTNVAAPARALVPTAEPPAPAAVWVRVRADDEAPAPDNGTEIGTRR